MATQLKDDYQRGYGTTVSPIWRDLVATDRLPPEPTLLEESAPDLGAALLPPQRFTSYEFHREEVEKVWKKVWQPTYREEEIPNVGDHFVYEVAGLSFLVVRSAPDEFRAFWNVCSHRGRRLVDESGSGAPHFRCGYHSWTFALDGELSFYPAEWDFPEVTKCSHALQKVKLDRWGGFIFINPDPDCAPLAEHLGNMVKHFDFWPLEDRYSIWHIRKRIDANWKVGIEAFLEAYHVVQTHPQALSSVSETGAAYDIWDEPGSQMGAQYSRSITPTGIPSPHARNLTRDDALSDLWALLNGLRKDDLAALPETITDRSSLAEWRREMLKDLTGSDYSHLSDSMMLDPIQYWVFPGFLPWVGEGLPLTYIFRPDKDSPDSCFMDIWMLIHKPESGEVPPAPPIIELGPTDRSEPYLGAMGLIFDQDDENMPQVQIGMKTWPESRGGVTLARYQEIRIRFLHQVIDRWIARK